MTHKRVMMIAYQFPPMGGAGVQRSAKFAKYLSQFGWEPIVVTSEGPKQLVDATLLEELKGVTIERTRNYNIGEWPKPFNLLGKLIQRKILIPDAEWLWYKMNMKHVLKLIEKYQPDVLYTTSYPYSDHLMGLEIKKKYPNLPWIVDFRDEWTKNPYILDFNYSKRRTLKEQAMERSVVEACDYLVTNSRFMLDGFKADYKLDGKSIVIPNGYDQCDFDGLNVLERTHKPLIITYSGSMYGRRKPDSFLQALQAGIESGAIDPKNIQVNFVGNFTTENKEKVAQYLGHHNNATFYPYMPHKKSIEFLLNSDILLLVVGSGEGSKNFYTGKIFEYINTGKTILTLAPKDGVAAEVIYESQTGVVVEDDDVPEITKALVDLYHQWAAGKLQITPNQEVVRQYSRLALTEKLSTVFELCFKQYGRK